MIETGFYWVKIDREWIACYYKSDGAYSYWSIPGNDCMFEDWEFEEIGYKIENPYLKENTDENRKAIS